MVGGLVPHQVDDRGPGPAGVVQVGQAVGQARPAVEQGDRRLARHAPVAVGGAGDHPFEQAQDAAHARDPVQGRHEMHLAGARGWRSRCPRRWRGACGPGLRRRSRLHPQHRVRHVQAPPGRPSPPGVRRSARAAATASSRWCGWVAPTMGAVMTGLAEHPGQGHLGPGHARAAPATSPRRSTTLRSASSVRAYRLLPNWSVSSRRVALALPGPGQAAAGQGAPGDHADALGPAERQHLPLLLAVEQVVVVLHGDEAGPAVAVGEVERLGELPGVHGGGAEVAHLARTSPRRAAPPGSPRWGSRSPSGGSGRGPRSPCPAGAGSASSSNRMALRDRPAAVGLVAHGAVDLGGDDHRLAADVGLEEPARASPRWRRWSRRWRCRRS